MADMHKVVIPAAGRGTRMRQPAPHVTLDPAQSAMADRGLKAMIPINGHPFLSYVLSALADAGYDEVCLVIGTDHQIMREHYTGAARPKRVRLDWVIQHEARGTADAILRAEAFVAGDHFLMVNSDNYYPLSVYRALRQLGEPGLVGFDRAGLVHGANISADRLTGYATVVADADGYLEQIVEKPDVNFMNSLSRDTFVSMNCWRFSPAIFDACRAIPRSARNEFELADAVQYSMSTLGERFRVVRDNSAVWDLSNRRDIADVAEGLRNVHPDP
jgi:glucose-1-phosphate thymidylyltransferase